MCVLCAYMILVRVQLKKAFAFEEFACDCVCEFFPYQVLDRVSAGARGNSLVKTASAPVTFHPLQCFRGQHHN